MQALVFISTPILQHRDSWHAWGDVVTEGGLFYVSQSGQGKGRPRPYANSSPFSVVFALAKASVPMPRRCNMET